MLSYRDSRLTKIGLVIFFLFVLGYAYFEGRGLLYGPSIAVEGRVLQVSEPFISIEGEAHRISALSMNGQTIPVTETGRFSEPYLLAAGYNRITLVARDRFGKETERIIEVMYTPKEHGAATSTSPDVAGTE